jgi:NADH:ubiquinone oxidoreductase subunit E
VTLEFSPQAKQKIDALLQRYPSSQPVVIFALHLAQKEHGDLRDDVLRLVADTLDLPYAHVYGVATFYTMFRRTPGGTNTLRVCTNISCMLRGAYDVLRAFETQLGLRRGQSNADFTLVAVVCGIRYFLDVTPEQVAGIVAELKAEPHPESEVV